MSKGEFLKQMPHVTKLTPCAICADIKADAHVLLLLASPYHDFECNFNTTVILTQIDELGGKLHVDVALLQVFAQDGALSLVQAIYSSPTELSKKTSHALH